MSEQRRPCYNADGRSKLSFLTHSNAKSYARNLGRKFDGQKKSIYHCQDCNQYHLATRK